MENSQNEILKLKDNTRLVAIILIAQLIAIAALVYMAWPHQRIGYISPMTYKLAAWAKDCNSPCILPREYMYGGDVYEFNAAAYILAGSRKQLVIWKYPDEHGELCASSCTIIVDTMQMLAPEDVCVDERVNLGFNRGTLTDNGDKFVRYIDYRYLNPQINEYFYLHPLDEKGVLTVTDVGFWSKAYPICHDNYDTLEPALVWEGR